MTRPRFNRMYINRKKFGGGGGGGEGGRVGGGFILPCSLLIDSIN